MTEDPRHSMVVRLAMVQMYVEPGDATRNTERAMARLGEAADHGAQLVVLPEALPFGWTDPSALEQAEPLDRSEFLTRLQELVDARELLVCSGFVERAHDRLFNSAVLLSPRRGVILRNRKIHELEIAHDLYSLGDTLGVAQTPLGRFGLMVCADGFAQGQVISRTLGYMGADIILSPSSWAVLPDHDPVREPYGRIWLDNYGPVARDFQIWIAGVSNVGPVRKGPWQGRRCIGCSLLIGPTGEPAVRGPYGIDAEMILYHDLELIPRPAQGDGWARRWASSAVNP